MTERFDGLGYEDTLPLDFERVAALPDGVTLAGLNAENHQVLVADASLDDQRPQVESKGDDTQALAEDLQRIEFKVNVLIQLVSRLMKQAGRMPPAKNVRLYATGIEWMLEGDEVLPGCGIVSLHVSRHFPEPLRLPGRILGTHSDAEGHWLRFAFEGLAPSVVELLERLVFRHHRRLVAGARSTPRS